jgi:NADPH:quinone reductase-like Zn-dependent oxidoreductase
MPSFLDTSIDRRHGMRAYVQRGHGGPEVCAFDDVPDPVPGNTEVVVQVRAAALNRLDLLQRNAPLVRGFALPHIAGMDVVGEVIGHGANVDVDRLPLGSLVMVDPVTTCRVCDRCRAGNEPYCETLATVGSTRPGGFAEYVSVPADRCWPVPSHLTIEQAAAVPVAHITAWRATVIVGRVTASDVVLINGANAGVSIAAMQFARSRGATVIGTVRGTTSMEQLRALGYHHLVDAADATSIVGTVRHLTGGHGADLVIDHVGPAQFAASVDSMALEGRMVFCGTTTGTRVDLSLTDVYWWGRTLIGAGGYRPADFGAMLSAIGAHRLVPHIDEIAPFVELPRLLHRLEHDRVVGKLVVTFD